MPNKYYAGGAERASKVNELFSSIAPRYDLINDLQSAGLHRLWKRRLMRVAGIRSGERVLDLCCGTGDIAFAAARFGALAVGLDFSKAMLKAAVGRSSGEVWPAFVQGDALRIPFADGRFDVVTISYGLRNLADFEAGLREMWRVARPGGRLLVLDFAKPDRAIWRRIYFGYLKCFVPVFGRVFHGDRDTYAYILESLHRYPAQHEVAGRMQKMGCTEVQTIALLGGAMSINSGTRP